MNEWMSFGAPPPCGHELWKWLFLLLSHEPFVQNTKLTKLHWSHYIQSGILSWLISNFFKYDILGICHFECCLKMLDFAIILTYSYETKHTSSTPCLEHNQKLLEQRHLVAKTAKKIFRKNACLLLLLLIVI